METRNVGIGRALDWEVTPDGIEFACVTDGLAAARVAVSPVGAAGGDPTSPPGGGCGDRGR